MARLLQQIKHVIRQQEARQAPKSTNVDQTSCAVEWPW